MDDYFSAPEPKDIKKLINLVDTRQIYNKLNQNIEFGGILCGKKSGEIADIEQIVFIPSKIPSQKQYLYDKNLLLNNTSMFCGNKEYIGTWHSHSKFANYPSERDREASSELDQVGCILTDNLMCYKGWKNIPVKKIHK